MDFLLIGLLRLIVPLAILKWPLPAFVVAGQLDRRDWNWLEMSTRSDEAQAFYQIWDKSLDTYYLTLAAVTVLKWEDRTARRLTLGAFLFRLVGVIAFFASSERLLLIIFPAVFERMFLFYSLFKLLSGGERMFLRTIDVCLVFPALLMPKLVEEYSIHYVGASAWKVNMLLPAFVSTPRLEYWTWQFLILALPAPEMTRLLLRSGRFHRRKAPTVVEAHDSDLGPEPGLSGELDSDVRGLRKRASALRDA